MTSLPPLPIDAIRETFDAAIRSCGAAVVAGPTGSGKSTRLPQWLAQVLAPEGDLQRGAAESGSRAPRRGPTGQVVVVEPRRIAARQLARRVAAETGSALGGLVGYETRDERVVSRETRVRFVTDGLLLRQWIRAPQAEGIAALVLDEFHERRWASDLLLALARKLRSSARPDLVLVVTSATLDVESVASWLAAPAIRAEGRTFPVEVSFQPVPSREPPWAAAASALRGLLASGDAGDVLVFMPGAYEIRKTIDACRALRATEPLAFHPLHSELPSAAQDAALAPASCRKVIVATNVAQTSLTIPGVRHVIDGGLQRVSRHDVRRGLDVLLTVKASAGAADQRAGRAGRTQPGTCRRLWTAQDHASRPLYDEPEVVTTDLSDALLAMAALGLEDVAAFPWLTPPGPERVAAGRELLTGIGAVDGEGRITSEGKRMAGLPMPPRLARMMLEACRAGCVERAAVWAAVVSEEEVLARPERGAAGAGYDSDFERVEEALASAKGAGLDPVRCQALGIRASAARAVLRAALRYRNAALALGMDRGSTTVAARGMPGPGVERCLLAAFPDHLAALRSQEHRAYELTRGRRAVLSDRSSAGAAKLLVPLEIQERTVAAPASGSALVGVKTVLDMVAPVDLEDVEACFPGRVSSRDVHEWNPARQAVERYAETVFEDLVLDRVRRTDVDVAVSARMLAERVASGELLLEQWAGRVEEWMARVRCVAAWFPERGLVAYSDDDLFVAYLEICEGARGFAEVKKRPCLPALKNLLSHADQGFVERMAPGWLPLPGGRKLKIRYDTGARPIGRARIQELYGVSASPRVGGGRVPVVIEILAPNMRPVQVTDDLAGFWGTHYPELKRALQRRYPRHEWR